MMQATVYLRHLLSHLPGAAGSYIALVCLCAGFISCKKPYNPPAINASRSYLVVEGIINSGNDSTVIKITRTVNIGNKAEDSVTNAVVTVEDDHNGSFPLKEKTNGIYVSAPLTIDKTKQYTLRIKTPDNKEYLSDFVPVQNTPPIDSVGFAIKSNGLQIYVNTHDATNAVKYYRWDYDEAWQFHSYFETQTIFKNHALVARLQSEQIYYCFNNDVSSDISLGNTSGLAQSVLNQQPIALIPDTSEKIEIRYSILVRQYALTADAYNFYMKLKKSTEQLGSIFDAMPSQIQGNIHCVTNPAEPVVGFISVNNTTSKRIFISNSILPATWVPDYPSPCSVGPIPIDIYTDLAVNPKAAYFVTDQTGYSGITTPICADCTLRGRTAAPLFWVY